MEEKIQSEIKRLEDENTDFQAQQIRALDTQNYGWYDRASAWESSNNRILAVLRGLLK